MQLILLAPPSESVLTELYGWGEVPFDWINARAKEFDDAAARLPNGPICMVSDMQAGNGECDFTHIYVYPIEPGSEQHNVVKQQREAMGNLRQGQFRIHHIHDGVETFAFM